MFKFKMTDEDNYFSNIYFEGIQTFEDLSIPREFDDIDSDETEFSNETQNIEEKIMLDKIQDLLTTTAHLSNDNINELFEKLLNELFEKLLNELFNKLFNELFNKLFNELFDKLSNNLSNNSFNNFSNSSLINNSLNELLNELNSLNDHNYTATKSTSAIKNVCQAKRKISQIQKKAKKIKIN
jgi:uncharacterized membrane-anchored protein YjiN (DUF445 family)